MDVSVAIQPFTEQHLQPLKQLFASYFPAGDRLLTAEYNRWLYADNPFGTARMVHIESGGDWAAFMAMVPVSLARREEQARGYFVVNVLVHPKFQGYNLFGRMIRAAREAVTAEEAALLGHPNELALKAWQRAKMHFHDSLRPSLALPVLYQGRLHASSISNSAQLQPAAQAAAQVVATGDGWRVNATPEYLEWRYLRHPTNRYHVQALHQKQAVVGLQVAKQVRAGVAMLIDQFVPPQFEQAATRRLPFPTLCFRPQARIAANWRSAPRLPWKKELPFFFTYAATPAPASSLEQFGLSASDF